MRPVRPPAPKRTPPGFTLPPVQRQRDGRRVIQEGEDGELAGQGAGCRNAGRGAEGGRGSPRGQTQGTDHSARSNERGQGHRQGTRASSSGGGQAHGAGQSAGSGQRDTGHRTGHGQGHEKDASTSSIARGLTQGHGQGTKARSSGGGQAHGAGQGAGSRRRGAGRDKGHEQGHGKDAGTNGKGKGAGDRGRDTRHGPEGRGKGARRSQGQGAGRVGASPHRVQANHLVAGLTNTLRTLRSRSMPTPAVIPTTPFIRRTAQPPYSHVENSTGAELDRLGLTALRAMVDVEPYSCSDLGGDPSDDEPPSLTFASPSEDNDPEDPENPSGRKNKKKRKTKRPEGRKCQEAKAITTSKIVLDLPEFKGKDLSEFAENFGRSLRMTGQTHDSGRVKCDLLPQCCKTTYLEKQVKQIVTKSATFADVLVALERQYPTYETNLSIRAEIQNLAVLPNNPKTARISELLADLDYWVGRLTPGSYSSNELLFWLVAKLPRELTEECRSAAERNARALNYEDLSVLLLDLALEKESDQQLNAYRPGG